VVQIVRTVGLAWLGPLTAAALCGCGGTDLAATEAPRPQPVPSEIAVGEKVESPAKTADEPTPVAATPVAPAAPVEPDGWDFFGPPRSADVAQDAGPAAEHLRLNGFIQFDGEPQRAVLALERDDRPVEIFSLAAGENRHGVTLVEFSEEQGTATVERPGRVVLRLEGAQRSVGVPSKATAGRTPIVRPTGRRTPFPPPAAVGSFRTEVPSAAQSRSSGRPAGPPLIPPPPPSLRHAVDRLNVD